MTEPKRHPHADVLIAIAEGREVQFRYRPDLAWIAYDFNYDATPLSAHEREWRVKPQKLKRWVNIYANLIAGSFETKAAADKAASIGQIAQMGRIACIEIEFEEGEGLDGR